MTTKTRVFEKRDLDLLATIDEDLDILRRKYKEDTWFSSLVAMAEAKLDVVRSYVRKNCKDL